MTDSEKLDLILSKMDQMESRMDQMEAKIDRMESRMDQMEAKLNQVEADVREMKLTIENEICVNIRQVAEGHHNLSKKLHEALKAGAENEMLSIRVNVLESEMRRVKEHIQIA